MIQSFQFSVAKTEACRFNDLAKVIELDSGTSGPTGVRGLYNLHSGEDILLF